MRDEIVSELTRPTEESHDYLENVLAARDRLVAIGYDFNSAGIVVPFTEQDVAMAEHDLHKGLQPHDNSVSKVAWSEQPFYLSVVRNGITEFVTRTVTCQAGSTRLSERVVNGKGVTTLENELSEYTEEKFGHGLADSDLWMLAGTVNLSGTKNAGNYTPTTLARLAMIMELHSGSENAHKPLVIASTARNENTIKEKPSSASLLKATLEKHAPGIPGVETRGWATGPGRNQETLVLVTHINNPTEEVLKLRDRFNNRVQTA